MFLDKEKCFLCRLLRFLCGALGGGGGILRRFLRAAYLFGIISLDTLLLEIPGYGVGGRQRRIIMERLLVKELRIGPDRRLFRFCRIPPGFMRW